MLEKFKDSFIVSKLIESFDISDYYDRDWDRKELKDISNFLDYVEDTEDIRLPLIPVLDLYRLYTVENFDCVDCTFNPDHTKDFIRYLKAMVANVAYRFSAIRLLW